MSFSGREILDQFAGQNPLPYHSRDKWSGSFADYLDIIRANPRVTRNAHERLYDMIISHGTEEKTVLREKITRYRFFDDLAGGGHDAVFGLDRTLANLVQILESAARGYGAQRRVLLLHGPVGSSKSTIVRLMKRGLEAYSRTDAGALYTFSWKEYQEDGSFTLAPCPMHEEPLRLIPPELRSAFLKNINSRTNEPGYKIQIRGELDPFCRFQFRERLAKYGGNWSRVLDDVVVRRLVLSETDRVGIGTFQPKDEKNQDATELTGDINYRKIAEFGSESDPRAFNFDGEFNIANRGLIEFVEVLKLDVAFLYDLLGASQEQRIKPKKFAQTDIDEVIIGHTNEPEYRKLLNNEFMEALRDRTVKIDVPYVTRLDDEIKIYEKDYHSRLVKKSIAPHTLEIAAMWSVMTRLETPRNASLTTLQKMKLYNGRMIPGFTEDHVRELHEEARREGMLGISPRYVQDKISNALVAYPDEPNVNPFMVLNELESGLKNHSLINSEEMKSQYRQLLRIVREEYDEILKNEVQRAVAADEDALSRLCANYIDHVKAYTRNEKVRNRFTGQPDEPDERMMRSIEEKIEIAESRKEDFRREIMNYIGALAIDGKKFDYRTNERLQRALEMKLFQDQKDAIRLTSIVANEIDKETQEKIEIVRSRLMRYFGYDEASANDVLHYVASIFARAEIKQARSG